MLSNIQIIDLREAMAKRQARWEAEQDYEYGTDNYDCDMFADAEAPNGHLPGNDPVEHGHDYQIKARG